jgi:hypothetical protein
MTTPAERQPVLKLWLNDLPAELRTLNQIKYQKRTQGSNSKSACMLRIGK